MPAEFLLTAPRTIEFQPYEEPLLAPNEVRVKSIISGIKHGTEMTLYSGHTPFRDQQFDLERRVFVPNDTPTDGFFPANLGSWLTGEIVEVGAAVTEFQVGDKVHGNLPHRPTNVVGANKRLYPLGDMEPETALFTDPAIYAIQAVHDAQIKVGDKVAVIGLGALGLLAVQLARLNGAEQVIAVDVMPSRLALAEQYGADAVLNALECDAGLEIKHLTGNKGVDAVIEISGSYAAMQTAVRAVHVGGVVVTASYYKGDKSQLNLGAEWHHNAPTMRSSMAVWGVPHRSAPMWDLGRIEETVIRLLGQGKLDIAGMIAQRFPYSEAPQAYQQIEAHPEASVKTALLYD